MLVAQPVPPINMPKATNPPSKGTMAVAKGIMQRVNSLIQAAPGCCMARSTP